jgi:hypothetical protein
MEIMPTVARQAFPNDLARHALAVTRSRLVVGVAMRSRVRRGLCIVTLVAIDAFARDGYRIGRWRAEGTLRPPVNVGVAGIVVNRSVAVGRRPLIEAVVLAAPAAAASRLAAKIQILIGTLLSDASPWAKWRQQHERRMKSIMLSLGLSAWQRGVFTFSPWLCTK